MPEKQGPTPPVMTGWQFAFSVVSNWPKLFALIVLINVLGWPSIVVKTWGQEFGWWQSEPQEEQDERRMEHGAQLLVLREIASGVTVHAEATDRMVTLLESHDRSSQNKDVIIAHLLLEGCELETQSKQRRLRCQRLEKLLNSYIQHPEGGH